MCFKNKMCLLYATWKLCYEPRHLYHINDYVSAHHKHSSYFFFSFYWQASSYSLLCTVLEEDQSLSYQANQENICYGHQNLSSNSISPRQLCPSIHFFTCSSTQSARTCIQPNIRFKKNCSCLVLCSTVASQRCAV